MNLWDTCPLFTAMLAEAEKYLGTPYVWGGSSPPNFDCSGFVSWVVNESGVGPVLFTGKYGKTQKFSSADGSDWRYGA